jgi:chromate transporter
VPGALVATAGILTGPFALVVTLGTILDRLRSRRPVRAALRGLTPAVAGLMAAAALTLGGSLDGGAELAIATAIGLTVNRFEVHPVPLLALGGVLRVALKAAGI